MLNLGGHRMRDNTFSKGDCLQDNIGISRLGMI